MELKQSNELTMHKMHLYSMSGTCALSVHIVLEWVDAPFEVTVIEHGNNHKSAFQQINPRGQVPALVLEDGKVLTEAAAILGYLADRYPQSGLGAGEALLPRYELSQLMSYLTSEVHAAFKPYFTPQRFLSDESQFAALRTHAFTTITPMLAVLDARLGNKRAFLDSGRSILDPYLYVILRWAEYVPGGLSAHRNLNRFRDELEGDAGVLRALAKEGISPVRTAQHA